MEISNDFEIGKNFKKIDGRRNNGGARPGSGRKPLLPDAELIYVKNLLHQHGAEIDENEKERKTRGAHLMDALYAAGKKGNIIAIKEYFDRQLGKAQQSLDMTSKGEKINLLELFNTATKEDE